MRVSDNFNRPNGSLGGNWSPVIPNNAETSAGGQGGILISGGGYGPINAHAGDAASLWTGASFGNNQWANAVVNSVAGYRAVLHITACTASGGNSTYTYTVTSGSDADIVTGGHIYVVITGMQNSANNGTFNGTISVSGTFVVGNASGVTESGSSGTGNCPSDSGAGVMVRASGNSAATLNGYFFHVGTNSFSGDGRTAYYELWKVVNGAGTILYGAGNSTQGTILPQIGDVIAINSQGTTISCYVNGKQLASVTDASFSSGVPGIWAWSISGPNEYVWANWATSTTDIGNNGTTLNNFNAGDGTFDSGIDYVYTQLSSDSLTEGTTLTRVVSDSFVRANGGLGTNWISSVGSVVINGNLCEAASGSSGAGVRNAAYWGGGQTFNNDQYAEATISAMNGTALGGPVVRAAYTGVNGVAGESGYICLIPKTGSSGSVIVQKEPPGTSILTIAGITPNVGDVFRISAVGTTITVYQNGVSIGSVTDSTLVSGFPGVFLFPNGNGQSACAFSSWAGGGVGLPSHFSMVKGNQNFASNSSLGAYSTVLQATTIEALAYENSVSWPNNQFCQGTFTGAAGSNGGIGVAVRLSANSDSGYVLYPFSGTGTLYLIKWASVGNAVTLASVPYVFNTGDVLRLEIFGNKLYGKINGATVLYATDSGVSSGSPGLFSESVGQVVPTTSGTLSTWSGGSIAQAMSSYSQPDCRNSACGLVPTTHVYPNGNRTVQSTLIYDVETSNNAAVPGTDSRAAGAPTDSRVAGIIPQNSRTPGTFGPGE